MVRGQMVTSAADRELERRVVNFLHQKHFPRLRTLEVESRQGVITIRGRVNSFHERQLCINCCQRVAGVTSLNDRIQVSNLPDAGQPRGFLSFVPGASILAPAG
jgi:osmotically-inducible protein OsmY